MAGDEDAESAGRIEYFALYPLSNEFVLLNLRRPLLFNAVGELGIGAKWADWAVFGKACLVVPA